MMIVIEEEMCEEMSDRTHSPLPIPYKTTQKSIKYILNSLFMKNIKASLLLIISNILLIGALISVTLNSLHEIKVARSKPTIVLPEEYKEFTYKDILSGEYDSVTNTVIISFNNPPQHQCSDSTHNTCDGKCSCDGFECSQDTNIIYMVPPIPVSPIIN